MRRILYVLTILVGMTSIGYGQQLSTTTAQGIVSPSFRARAGNLQSPRVDPQMHMVEGKLSRVDAHKQLLWIKTKEGLELQFRYTKDTAVEGTGESVEGLANMSGSNLRVQYSTQGSINTAVSIEVLANG